MFPLLEMRYHPTFRAAGPRVAARVAFRLEPLAVRMSVSTVASAEPCRKCVAQFVAR